MSTIVVFTKNNARLLKNFKLKSGYDKNNVMIDPDLSLVKGIPPHFWKRDGELLVEMSPEEKKVRMMKIKYFGTDCDVLDFIYPNHLELKLRNYKTALISSLILCLLALLFGVYALRS